MRRATKDELNTLKTMTDIIADKIGYNAAEGTDTDTISYCNDVISSLTIKYMEIVDELKSKQKEVKDLNNLLTSSEINVEQLKVELNTLRETNIQLTEQNNKLLAGYEWQFNTPWYKKIFKVGPQWK